VRQSKIPNQTIETILKIRLDNPTYGKEKIKRILERDYNLDNISSSFIGRILRKLDEIGLIHLKGSIN
jgi:DNA-binding transcriptional regulator WhiA